jgi:mannose-1-phosphate guanylyltransferase
MQLRAVILCGGRGERFWPKSRRSFPKQFISLFGNRSLVQATSDRIRPLCPLSRQVFVAPAEFRQVLREQVPGAGAVFEPVGRNTAPAIGLAAAYLHKRDPKTTMVVLPADHLIENRKEFVRNVKLAAQLAQQGLLVTFGIPPDRPDTGYGYIGLGKEIVRHTAGVPLAAYKVLGFREKPSAHKAREYVAAGNFAWNSGMFVWRVDAILDAMRQHMPEFSAALQTFAKAIGTKREAVALKRLYARTQSISIDYAVMEKAANVAAVRATFDWDDVGSWLAVGRHGSPDQAGNAANGLLVAKDTRDCIVDTDTGLVACLGVEGLVIVRAGDAVLVAKRDELGNIKQLLADIAAHRKAKASL